MTTHLSLQRMLVPTAQVSSLAEGTVTLPSARKQATAIPFQAMESIQTASGSGTSYTFSNIPDGFTHLELHLTTRNTQAASSWDWVYFQLNDDAGGNYYMYGLQAVQSGSSLSPTYALGSTIGYAGATPQGSTTSGSVSGTIIRLLNYSNRDRMTTFQSLSSCDVNSSESIFMMLSGHWNNKAVVNKITIANTPSRTFDSISHVELYGIKAEW